MCFKKSIFKILYTFNTLVWRKKEKVNYVCFFPKRKVETLNFSLVWMSIGLYQHSFKEKQHLMRSKLLLRKWIVIYLNSDAFGTDKKIYVWQKKLKTNKQKPKNQTNKKPTRRI